MTHYQNAVVQRSKSRHGGNDRLRGCAVHERVADVEIDRRLGQLLQLLVRPEHQRLEAGHHERDALIRNLGKRLLAEIEERHVGAVAEQQKLEMMLPHPEITLDRAPIAVDRFDHPQSARCLLTIA
jgi:hypothetical protein